ncbi:Huntingtin interacting protein [Fasciola gigantica]|uniref:Huntingtin interacting protein n=1 Tax=Fasciola gigantica TaxID=46835 RepID=A0A504YI41_FASGI|nr:Huntingtin interacting protein [Fasciola gigantica]
MKIFAPCPHHALCGKRDTVCNISVKYYHFGLTREKNEPLTEIISYLIVSRGDWRKHQVPTVEAESDYLPRLVSHQTGNGPNLTHDICLPDGSLERVVFPKKQTDKSLFFFLKHAHAGDLVPCEPLDSSKPVDLIESDRADD